MFSQLTNFFHEFWNSLSSVVKVIPSEVGAITFGACGLLIVLAVKRAIF